eukprot:3390827-Pleurochrysis_carterae.AAC.3
MSRTSRNKCGLWFSVSLTRRRQSELLIQSLKQRLNGLTDRIVGRRFSTPSFDRSERRKPMRLLCLTPLRARARPSVLSFPAPSAWQVPLSPKLPGDPYGIVALGP